MIEPITEEFYNKLVNPNSSYKKYIKNLYLINYYGNSWDSCIYFMKNKKPFIYLKEPGLILISDSIDLDFSEFDDESGEISLEYWLLKKISEIPNSSKYIKNAIKDTYIYGFIEEFKKEGIDPTIVTCGDYILNNINSNESIEFTIRFSGDECWCKCLYIGFEEKLELPRKIRKIKNKQNFILNLLKWIWIQKKS